MRLPRATYANVVSTIALFIALGGVSWAAATLPKNSVGNSQLKKNAVTGSKVKDGSLSSSDFAGGLPQGPQGLRGPTGETGPAGPRGETGAKGEAGAQGTQGPPGVAGTNGTNGTNGTDGVSGYEVNETGELPVGPFTIGIPVGCSGTKQPISGGWKRTTGITDGDLDIARSYPLEGPPGNPGYWFFEARVLNTGLSSVPVVFYVVCANVR